MLLSAYRLGLDMILRGFIKKFNKISRGFDPKNADDQKRLLEVLLPVVRDYRKQTGTLANEFMQSQAEEHGAEAFTPPIEGYADFALKNALRESRSLDELSSALTRHIETAARRQMVRAVPDPEVKSYFTEKTDIPEEATTLEELDNGDLVEVPNNARPLIYPVGWARVLTGAENCPFCIMLASRGPVYTSRSHASTVGKRERYDYEDYKGRKRKVTRRVEDREKYHNNCDCTVVPVYDAKADWQGKEQYKALDKAWRKMRFKSKFEGTSLKEWEDYLSENPIEIPNIREPAKAA